MRIKLFLCAALLTVTLLPDAGFADGQKPKDPREHPEKKMFDKLGITPEQEAKLREIHAAAAPTKKLYKSQIEVVRQKIKVELQKDKPSKSAMNKYAAEIGNLHKQMNIAAIEHLMKVKAVLTPEQFNVLSQRGFIEGPDRDRSRTLYKPRDSRDGEKFRGPPKDGYGPEGVQFRKHRYHDKEGGKNLGGGFVPSAPAEPEPQPAPEAAPTEESK